MATQQTQASTQAQIEAANRAFLQLSLEKVAYCPVTGGSGTTAAYVPGNTLYYDFPTIGSAFIKALLITYNLTVTPASGGTNAYALNAASPWNMFSLIKLDYGNTQVNTHPYFLKCLDQLQGYQRGAQNRVLAGNNDNLLSNQIVGPTPLAVGSGNVWQGKMLLKLNVLGEDSAQGILPAMSVGNTPQLKLTCTPNFMGTDPLMNVVNGTGNSTPAVTVTGNINVDAIYLDGSSMRTNIPMALNLSNEPTGQYYWESALTPFNSGITWQRKQISTRLEHWYVVSVIIDGQQSNTFLSNYSNLSAFEIGPDQSGQNIYQGWNSGNNISIYDYFDRQVRRVHGQDMDLGVVVWVDAPARGVTNPENRHGGQTLNMYPANQSPLPPGFVATNHGYQVNTVSSSNSITPRVETFLWSMNYDGLKLA